MEDKSNIMMMLQFNFISRGPIILPIYDGILIFNQSNHLDYSDNYSHLHRYIHILVSIAIGNFQLCSVLSWEVANFKSTNIFLKNCWFSSYQVILSSAWFSNSSCGFCRRTPHAMINLLRGKHLIKYFHEMDLSIYHLVYAS